MPDHPVWSREPGGTSQGPYFIDFAWTGSQWTLDVEGRAGESYEVTVRGAALASVDGAEIVDRSDPTTRVRVRMPASTSEWSSTRITFTPSR